MNQTGIKCFRGYIYAILKVFVPEGYSERHYMHIAHGFGHLGGYIRSTVNHNLDIQIKASKILLPAFPDDV